LYKKKQVYLIGERKITSKMYLGGELDYKVESHRNKDKSALPEETNPGAPGDELTRVGMSVVYDSRDIYTSATTGAFYKLIYSKLLHILGSLANFDQIKFESRNFFTLRPKHILGFNTNYESLQGDNRPFYLLPQMGSSFIQRGYYQGRYREQNYAAIQAEYRWNFFRKFGLAAFIGAGEVFKNKEFNFPAVKPNWGIGLRYLYDEVSRINFRVDYGWGTKAAGEDRIEGVYFSIGEAF
jgi:outer membrane protein assembly factor BamA